MPLLFVARSPWWHYAPRSRGAPGLADGSAQRVPTPPSLGVHSRGSHTLPSPPHSMVPCTCRDVRIPVRPSVRRPVRCPRPWSLGLLRSGLNCCCIVERGPPGGPTKVQPRSSQHKRVDHSLQVSHDSDSLATASSFATLVVARCDSLATTAVSVSGHAPTLAPSIPAAGQLLIAQGSAKLHQRRTTCRIDVRARRQAARLAC